METKCSWLRDCWLGATMLLAALLVVGLCPIGLDAQGGVTGEGDYRSSVESHTESIRIATFYDPSIGSLSEDQQTLIKNVLVHGAVSWLREVVQVRPTRSSIKLDRVCQHPSSFLIDNKRYCRGDCVPERKCGPVTVPQEHLKPCQRCDDRGHNCEVVPASSPELGAADSDLVLYVSAVNEVRCRRGYPLVYAAHCQQEEEFDRPIAAFLNFCPYSLTVDPALYHSQQAMVLHELIHAMAFSEELFPFFRDEHGRPRSQRTSSGEPAIGMDSRYAVDPNTLRTIRYAKWTTIDDVVHTVRVIVTPNVVREVRAHFNCSEVVGAELENQGSPGSSAVHWEKRVFGDELMTASLSMNPVLSRITLALLEDSGWYKPDYNYAGQLKWGQGWGCSFATDSCCGWVKTSRKQRVDPAPFCNNRDQGREGCVDQRMRIGECVIKEYPHQLPQEYQYIGRFKGGTQSIFDYCPIYYALEYRGYQVGRSCVDPEHAPASTENYALEVHGPGSRCVLQHDPWVTKGENDNVTSTLSAEYRARCYEFSCSARRLFIHVGDTAVRCSSGGQKKDITYQKDNVTYAGSIICPAYEEFCAGYNCLRMCSGHGTCKDGYCRCEPGYFGDDCSRNYMEKMQTCADTTCQNNGTCVDTDYGFSCDCPPGYTGATCESEAVPDPCTHSPCGRNGNCARIRGGMKAVCHCYQGYEGETCDEVIDYCRSSEKPCLHGACLNDTTPTCVCEPGFSGSQCENRTDYCVPDPCQNGGTCINRLERNTFSCECPAGFEGTVCENSVVDPCVSSPCSNGGVCTRISETDFECACRGDYVGETCESEVDHCQDSPCFNGATCVSVEGSYECVCSRGYKGLRCRKRSNPCKPNPCINGKCIRMETHGEIWCRCKDSFMGEFCEESVPTCTPNPCLNDGRCTLLGGEIVTCTCLPLYTGRYCESAVTDSCDPNSGECPPATG